MYPVCKHGQRLCALVVGHKVPALVDGGKGEWACLAHLARWLVELAVELGGEPRSQRLSVEVLLLRPLERERPCRVAEVVADKVRVAGVCDRAGDQQFF